MTLSRRHFMDIMISGILLQSCKKDFKNMPISSGLDCLHHDHADGAITNLEKIPEYYRLSGMEMPAQIRDFRNLGDLRQKVVAWYTNPQIDMPTKFGLLTNVLQNPDTLFLFGYQYVKVRAGQGVRYCEATFAPQYHVRGDNKSKAALTEKEVVDAFLAGTTAAEKDYPQIEANALVTIGREIVDPEHPEWGGIPRAKKIIDIIAEGDRSRLVGVGLVSDEAAYPPEMHVEIFNYANERGIPVDAHAGEWANLPGQDPNSPKVIAKLMQNMRTAVYTLKIKRGSHFRLLSRDKELCKYMIDNNIGVSSCPGSYLYSGLIKDVRELELDVLLDMGLLVSLHPDDDLFMDDINKVFWDCLKAYNFTPFQVKQLRRNAWLTRFGNRKEHKIPA